MFFDGYNKTNPKVLVVDEEYASRLREVLASNGKLLFRGYTKKRWAQDFCTLRTQVGDDRIKLAFEWYITKFGQKYTPKAYCAKSFRKKFLAIEDAMKRDKEHNPDLVISDETKQLTKLLIPNNWPNDCGSKLLDVVEMSLLNAREFRTKLKACDTKLAKEVRKRFRGAEAFVETWMEKMYRIVISWKDRRGDFQSFVTFTHDHKEFTRMGREWSRSYSGNAQEWDSLIALLYKD